MTEGKRNQKQEGSEVKTFTVPFALKESKENIFNKARKLHQKGNIPEAVKHYQQIINQGCNDHRVFSNYGVILRGLGKLKEAELVTRKAIELNPDFADLHSNLGIILRDLGKLEEAELSTRKAIELNPDFTNAYANLGEILSNLGNLKEAELSTRKAIEIKPDSAMAHSNLGIILQDLGKSEEAELSTRKAIEIKSDYAEAHYNLGNILRDLGKSQKAELSYRKAIEIKPDYADAYCNLGNILRDFGKSQEAELSYRKAIKIKPDFAIALSNLGGLLIDLGKSEEAELSYRKAIEIKPDFAEAHSNLGNILICLDKEKDAKKHFSYALENQPNNICFYINSKLRLSPILNNIEQIDTEREQYKRQLEILKNNKNMFYEGTQTFNTNIFYFAYQNRLDDKYILEELSDTISKVKGVIFKDFSRRKYLAISSKRTNLKVGICSEFLRNSHTIGKLYTKVILDLLKAGIEINIYIPPNKISHSDKDLVENIFKRVIYLPKSIDKASRLIFSDDLDVLFYPDIGMSNYTYILALSRLALVQATSLGHPNTSGIKNIDYFITNEIVPHHPSSSYTERLIKFSRLPFNYPTPKINESNLSNKNIINSDDNFIIGLTQSLFKLHPDFDKVLESILDEIKNACLILIKDKHEYTTEKLKNRWKKQSSLLLERSIFLDRMSKDDFINTTKNCHIMLDPFYFGSGNTFYEAMAFGIPFITYPFSQRGSLVASGYKQMGVKNPPIASSPEDYINWCKKYANNSLLLKNTKDELKERAQKYLFNDNEIYKEYYTFFTEAVKIARQGEFLEDNWKPFTSSKI
ncbi:tetratricopeptide repeat protein [Prochlorococcus marinus]|uniref:tetratricopeptide repeat protein n=1 Tax=Prochlorococcus marinus TaxID=1219 RepID=UPI0022B5AE90|nr:glycosyltransferase family 41 protein [Prochlorococcus marinus]